MKSSGIGPCLCALTFAHKTIMYTFHCEYFLVSTFYLNCCVHYEKTTNKQKALNSIGLSGSNENQMHGLLILKIL